MILNCSSLLGKDSSSMLAFADSLEPTPAVVMRLKERIHRNLELESLAHSKRLGYLSGLCVRASLTVATVLEKGQPAGRWAAGRGASPCSPALL